MDVASLKVTELRRELRARGLSSAGDKAQLVGRLELALESEPHADDQLDAELELAALEEPLVPAAPEPEPEPEPPKKIVLHRPTPPTTSPAAPTVATPQEPPKETATEPPKPTRPVLDSKARLEMRAKRFGTTPGADALIQARKARFGADATENTPDAQTKSAEQLKEARKARFGGPTSTPNLDLLKKRAERFGVCVSKSLVEQENEKRLLRRKERFNTATS